MDVAGVIRRCSLFERLSDEEVADLTSSTRIRELDAGEVLFVQGEPADWVYLVATGQLRLSKITSDGEQVIVSFVVAEQLFAVVAAMQRTTYPVTAEALVNSTLLEWGRGDLGELFTRHPHIAFEAVQVVSGRMRQLQERFRDLATLPVSQRLARALLQLGEQTGRRDESGDGRVHLELSLTRQDLAELTGTTLYTASRVLSKWDASGIIEAGRRSIVLVDLERLDREATGDAE